MALYDTSEGQATFLPLYGLLESGVLWAPGWEKCDMAYSFNSAPVECKAVKNTATVSFATVSANNKVAKANRTIGSFKYHGSVSLSQTTKAEVNTANAFVQHNIPQAVADHFSPLFKDILPDSEITKGYASASTKTTCMINGLWSLTSNLH